MPAGKSQPALAVLSLLLAGSQVVRATTTAPTSAPTLTPTYSTGGSTTSNDNSYDDDDDDDDESGGFDGLIILWVFLGIGSCYCLFKFQIRSCYCLFKFCCPCCLPKGGGGDAKGEEGPGGELSSVLNLFDLEDSDDSDDSDSDDEVLRKMLLVRGGTYVPGYSEMYKKSDGDDIERPPSASKASRPPSSYLSSLLTPSSPSSS